MAATARRWIISVEATPGNEQFNMPALDANEAANAAAPSINHNFPADVRLYFTGLCVTGSHDESTFSRRPS